MGILAALLEARSSGKGQVIDAAIAEGSASLMSMFHGWQKLGLWRTDRCSNLLDGAAYFYDVYETADGHHVSVGPLEPKFYALLVDKAGLDADQFGEQAPADKWPALKQQLAEVFRKRTRQEWCDLLEGTDACFAPVLDFTEAPRHPHNRARGTYISIDGVEQPAPAPKFGRTTCDKPTAPHAEGADSDAVLHEIGFSDRDIAALRGAGVLA